MCSPGRYRLVLGTPVVGFLRLSLVVLMKPVIWGGQVSASSWPLAGPTPVARLMA